MAVWVIKNQSELSGGYVLAPERYDPRRVLISGKANNSGSVLISTIARVVRKTVTTSSAEEGSYLILDTSNAQEGVIVRPKKVPESSQIGSAKKIVEVNDVIVSRLRPYLRQIAFIDREISNPNEDSIVCSTEFFVLRSLDDRPIAFLVPFLLSQPIQQVLAAAQEGGHHPRFSESTLATLTVPERFLQRRDEISEAVEASIKQYRQCEKCIGELVRECNEVFLED